MKTLSRQGLLLIALASFHMQVYPKEWDFNATNNLNGWQVPTGTRSAVMGGSLWITISSSEINPNTISTTIYQVLGDALSPIVANKRWFEPMKNILTSPSGLNISATNTQQVQVRLKVINLSPVTDLFLQWRALNQAERYSGSKRCTLKADIKEWQSVTCYVDKAWQGTIDQIAISIPMTVMRGELWISSIEASVGAQEPPRDRPDVASDRVVPRITLPGVSQADFVDAFKVLDECLVVDVPLYGFTYPVLIPDGHGETYGQSWWTEDASYNLAGAKWANQAFAENVMRGFRDAQAMNPDGRLDNFGWVALRGQVADESTIPGFFEAAYDVARRTSDIALREEIYGSMRKYLDWWLSPVKRDNRTGLISGVGEETFGEPDQFEDFPQAHAPVDTNVAVAIGAARTAEVASSLGKHEESIHYDQIFQELSNAINAYLWDSRDGAYYIYDLHAARRVPRLILSTFYPLRLSIAPAAQRDRLIARLLDPTQFNWGKIPLTTLAMTEADYKATLRQTSDSHYNFTGDVWAWTNTPVIDGLRESGRPDLAAELNWATIKAFNANYREALLPFSGQGIGAKRYGESASLYIRSLIENLFGIDFDAIKHRITITPLVPKALYGESISLKDVILPTAGNTRLSVEINQSSTAVATITVNISGLLPDEVLQVTLPGNPNQFSGPAVRHFVARFR